MIKCTWEYFSLEHIKIFICHGGRRSEMFSLFTLLTFLLVASQTRIFQISSLELLFGILDRKKRSSILYFLREKIKTAGHILIY